MFASKAFERLTLLPFAKEVLMMRRGIPLCRLHLLRSPALYLPAILLALFFMAPTLRAQFLVRPVNLAYLAQRADVIVQGRVVDAVHESLPGYPNIPTVKVTLSVENMIRGPEGDTYVFREVFVGLRSRVGEKSYTAGQQLFLFLTASSKYGLSSPVGIEQGRFHVRHNPEGGPMVVNEKSNIGLFRNVAEEARMAGRPLTESQLAMAASEQGPVQLNEFESMVRKLMLIRRIQ
jgi:hypothetical protein